MKLICDYREKHVLKILNTLCNHEQNQIECITENLNIGDFIIGNIIIERKTHADLASSILDGRYKEQCYRLEEYKKENPDVKILYFIEGNFDFCMNAHNINKEKLISAIFTLIYEKGFSVILTKHLNETCDFLMKFCKKFYTKYDVLNNDLDDNTESLKELQNIVNLSKQGTKKNTQINKDNIGILMMCNIPQVSVHIASTLLKPFNNNFYDFLTKIREDEDYLDSIKIEGGKDKKPRKLNKQIIGRIKEYFLKDLDSDHQDQALS